VNNAEFRFINSSGLTKGNPVSLADPTGLVPCSPQGPGKSPPPTPGGGGGGFAPPPPGKCPTNPQGWAKCTIPAVLKACATQCGLAKSPELNCCCFTGPNGTILVQTECRQGNPPCFVYDPVAKKITRHCGAQTWGPPLRVKLIPKSVAYAW
jgi:hypothetical protein